MVSRSPNLLVPHYLIHCYRYYVLDDPLISDAAFDRVVQMLQAQWDHVQHRHKDLLDRDFLKSGFHIVYPSIVEGAAEDFAAGLRAVKQ